MRYLASLAALIGIVGGCSQGTGASTGASTGTGTGTGSGTSTGTSTGSSTGSTGGACGANNTVCPLDDAGPPCCGTCAFDRYYNVDLPYCQEAYTQPSDCPDQDLFFTCYNGACVHNVCSDQAGAGQICDAGGENDGTCLPVSNGDGQCLGVCWQAGTATTTCDPIGTRASSAGLCIPGLMCVSIADGGSRCSPACNPSLYDAGAVCVDAGFSYCGTYACNNGEPFGFGFCR